MDAHSHAVDNNRGSDYRLQLVGALSEEQIIERQAVALAEMEEKRLQVKTSALSLFAKPVIMWIAMMLKVCHYEAFATRKLGDGLSIVRLKTAAIEFAFGISQRLSQAKMNDWTITGHGS